MSTCLKCGRPLEPEARFCQVCGTEVSGEQVRTVLTSTAVPDINQDPATVPTGTASPDGQESDDPILDRLRQLTIGDYEILLELGRGGMAAVYLAHDLALDRKVAVKVMFPETLGSEGAAERFRREARTSASLNHPNIIPIYTVSEKSDLLYFIMQFIAGRPLDDIIREAAPLPIRLVQTIMHHVGGALAYAHRRGVVHRDIKPSNIMLDEDGWAIVTDFGIAKVSAAESITRTGSTIGTPSYMSPEQCSAKEVGGASDQYALGIMAYEMLVGKAPFDGETAMQIMFQHVSEPVPPLLDARSDCPPELAAAIHKMLEKKPEDRWDTLESAMAAVGAVPADETEEVRTAIVTLAKTELSRDVLAKVRTPQSPLPATLAGQRSKAQGPVAGVTPRVSAGAPTKPKSKMRWLWPALGVVAAAVAVLVLTPLVGSPPSPTGALPTTTDPITTPTGPAVASVRVDGSSDPLTAGSFAQFSASALDAAGAPIAGLVLEWISSDETVARVSPDGIITAVSPGNAQITARHESHSASMSVVVVTRLSAAQPTGPGPVATVAVSPSRVSLAVGESAQFQAEPRDSRGNLLTGRSVTWASSDNQIAVIGSDGTLLALQEGSVQVIATSGSASSQANVTVAPVPVARVQVLPGSTNLMVGESTQLSASTLDAQNRGLTNRTVSWASSAPTVARVSANGSVTAVSAGTATITASSGSVRGTAAIRVAEVARPTPRPDSATLRREVEETIQRYARAIESRDINQVRQVAPGLSVEQINAWQQFFDAAESLTITFTAANVDLQGNVANADVTGSLRYDGDQTTTQFRATLERRASSWVITRIQ